MAGAAWAPVSPGPLLHYSLFGLFACSCSEMQKCWPLPRLRGRKCLLITCLNFTPYGATCDKAGGLGGSWRSKELCLFRTNDLTLISSSGSRSVVPMKKLMEIKSLFQEGEHRWGEFRLQRQQALLALLICHCFYEEWNLL